MKEEPRGQFKSPPEESTNEADTKGWIPYRQGTCWQYVLGVAQNVLPCGVLS